MRHTDAELVRLHAGLKGEAFDGLRKTAAFSPEAFGEQLRLHGPALAGAGIGSVIAPQGKDMESILAGAMGGIVGNSMTTPEGGTRGYTGAVMGPVAYALYHHLTKDDQPQQMGVPHGYIG